MLIQELFTQPFKWIWVDQESQYYTALFSTGKFQYEVNFELYDEAMNTWNLEFNIDPESIRDRIVPGGAFGITKTGDAAQVFATVIKIIKNFKKINPDSTLRFTAEEPSRQKLYLSLVKKLSSGRYDVTHETGKTVYTV